MFHLLRMWRYTLGRTVLGLIALAWLGVALQPCAMAANQESVASKGMHHSAPHHHDCPDCAGHDMIVHQDGHGKSQDSGPCHDGACSALHTVHAAPMLASVSGGAVELALPTAVFWLLPTVLYQQVPAPPIPAPSTPLPASHVLEFRVLLI